MSDVFNWEKANLFAGDHDTATSNHLALLDLKLPMLEENTVDWNPGGAPVASEIETGINKLEGTFNLAGWTPEVMKLIGASAREKQVFTAYGVLRGRRLGNAMEGKAVMQGRLGRVNPTNFRRGDLHQHEYTIKAIVHYELYFGDAEIYYWDMLTNELRIGGEPVNYDDNRILRIGSAPATAAVGVSAGQQTA